jgi:hypothetical protein
MVGRSQFLQADPAISTLHRVASSSQYGTRIEGLHQFRWRSSDLERDDSKPART